jgi:hypothetical protein
MDDVPHFQLEVSIWLLNFSLELLALSHFHHDPPLFLDVGHEPTSVFFLFLDSVKVVNNDTDEEIHDEQRPNDHIQYEVNGKRLVVIFFRL